MPVTDDRRGMDWIIDQTQFLESHSIDVGVLSNPDPDSVGEIDVDSVTFAWGDDKRPTDKTVGEIAVIHELGLGNMPDSPPRSFIAHPIDTKTIEIERFMGEQVQAVFSGRMNWTADKALRFTGEFVVDLMKETIRTQDNFVELSEIRKRQKVRAGKSGNQALLNWGQLVNSIRYQVVAD